MTWQSDYLQLAVPAELYEELRKSASRNKRSAQKHIERILREYLETEVI